eukprot:c28836_g1_i1 orf=1281-3389(+)
MEEGGAATRWGMEVKMWWWWWVRPSRPVTLEAIAAAAAHAHHPCTPCPPSLGWTSPFAPCVWCFHFFPKSAPTNATFFRASVSNAKVSKVSVDYGSAGRSWRRSLEPSQYGRRKQQHPPMYETVDEETGEKVVVLGVDGEEPPIPTPADLKWKYVKVARPGDITDEGWFRALDASDAANDSTDTAFTLNGMISNLSEDHTSGFPMGNKADSQKTDLTTRGLFSKLKVQSVRTLSKSVSQISEGIACDKGHTKVMHRGAENLEGHPRGSSLDAIGRNCFSRRKSKMAKQTGHNRFNPRTCEDFFSTTSFKDLGASDDIIQALSSLQVQQPSQIQAMAYHHVFEGQSCIIAEQTGSGKTLAYLAPLAQRLAEEEKCGLSRPLSRRPRVVIVVPTSELAAQVLNVCRFLCKGGILLKSMVATGGFKLKTQLDSLEDGPDILIATPGRLLQLVDSRSLVLDNLISVVLDEVDILFDNEDFLDAVKKIEEFVSLRVQHIHVSATLPVEVHNNLLESHPESVPLVGPGLHCTAAGLQEVLVDCSGDGDKTPETAFENKKTALLQLVDQQPAQKTIIFCNKIETCRKVENVLKRFDRRGSKVSVLPYHAALSQEVRLNNLQQFAGSEASKPLFLVCSDRASRGLDLVDVEHVVLFDFPRDPSEYIRRVGRTARSGGEGKAFVFVVGKQVALARHIMTLNEKGHPLHTVP